MQKGWSLLFAVVLLAAFGIWAAAPFVGWWLPKQVATFGDKVDFLYYVILAFTAFFFVLTEAILVYAMWKYAYDPAQVGVRPRQSQARLAWTVIPALCCSCTSPSLRYGPGRRSSTNRACPPPTW